MSGFWQDESTPHLRRLLLDEAARKHSGATRWEFNMYAVLLDFDGSAAVVEDLLGSGTSHTVPLQQFLDSAAAFEDDASIGDGLTEAERNQARFAGHESEPPDMLPRDEA